MNYNHSIDLALKELRGTLGKIELALGAISDGIVWTDSNGHIQWCNRFFDDMIGLSHIDTLGKSLVELLPLMERGIDLPFAAHPLNKILKTRKPLTGYYGFKTGKRVLSLEFKAELVKIDDSEVTAVFVIRDITKVKEAEHLKLQGIALQAAANAIVITDGAGNVQWANQAFTHLTGYTFDEVFGKNLSVLKSGKQNQSFYKQLWDTIKSGDVWSGRLINRRKDGSLYKEEQTITPVILENDVVDNYIAIKQDVTERELLQSKLKSSNDLLTALNELHLKFINKGPGKNIFKDLLDHLLDLTGSEYGLIGETVYKKNGTPFFRPFSIRNISLLNEDAGRRSEERIPQEMKSHHLDTLLEKVLATGRHLISNDLQNDDGNDGISGNTPPVKSFLALPFYSGPRMVGIVCLANRKNGYTESNIASLLPFLTTYAYMTEAYRNDLKRQGAEEKLRSSETKMRAVLNAAIDGIITIDDKGILQELNPAAEKIFGYTTDEVIGRNIKILMPEPDHSRHPHYINNYVNSGVPKIIGTVREVIACRKDGSTFPADLSISEIDLKGNKSFTGIIRDITQRKKDEEALKNSNKQLQKYTSDLSRTVSELSDEIKERKRVETQMRLARKEAEEASRAKSEFLAGMSHEIRTPMNAILGMADLLQETVLTPEQRKYVDVFQSAGDNLLNIIDGILDVSKIEAGQITLESIRFNLNTLVQSVCDVMTIRARKKNLGLTFNILADVSTDLLGDPTRLRQILLNLVGNAIKFTDAGEISVQVKRAPAENGSRKSNDENIELLFSVTDTGIGILPEQKQVIFDMFSQADSSTTRKYGGTGLGLTISKLLVELMGGLIWVESPAGTIPSQAKGRGPGSSFFFLAKFTTASGRQEPVKQPPADIEFLHNLNILLVEDSTDNQLLIQSYLKKSPHQLDIAENGEIAVKKIKTRGYDIVLMDVQMPVMDGHTATREIRKWELAEGKKKIPIIALTAHALTGDAQKSLDAGCSAHLTKPIKKAALMAAIKKHGEKTK